MLEHIYVCIHGWHCMDMCSIHISTCRVLICFEPAGVLPRNTCCLFPVKGFVLFALRPSHLFCCSTRHYLDVYLQPFKPGVMWQQEQGSLCLHGSKKWSTSDLPVFNMNPWILYLFWKFSLKQMRKSAMGMTFFMFTKKSYIWTINHCYVIQVFNLPFTNYETFTCKCSIFER